VGDNNSSYHDPSATLSTTLAGNVGNLTWTSGNFSGNNATIWKNRRTAAKFPGDQIILPSEVTEIKGVSDNQNFDKYTDSGVNIKRNEGRLSSLFPGATTQSRFFTIYAFAQALDKMEQPESEAVTKTLVEVDEIENTPPTNPPTYSYKVKKLYTQPISVP
jgi:hypothetical protein